MNDSAQLPHNPDDDVLTVEEVAEWLRMKPAWVRAHASGNRRPQLPGMKMGKYMRFRRGDVKKTLEHWARGEYGDLKKR